MLIVRSPVRISFGGGGTDLPAYYQQYGGAVVSATINKYFYTILGRRLDQQIQIISSDLRVCENWRDFSSVDIEGSGLEIPVAVLKHFNRELCVDLFLASEIPPGTGLGSSASVCVNVLKTLASYFQLGLSKYELAERAFYIARQVLQHHAGKQDEYAAAFGGLNFLEFLPDGGVRVEPLELAPDLLAEFESSLLLFFTGAAHHSWGILAEQETSTRAGQSEALAALHKIKHLAYRMRDSLAAGDLSGFAAMLDESWQAKKRVSTKISNQRIDTLYELARESGAQGGKITGAGGGGFLLLYCPEAKQEAVRQALAQQGLKEMTFRFDYQGAHVLVNDPFIDHDEHSASRWTYLPLAG